MNFRWVSSILFVLLWVTQAVSVYAFDATDNAWSNDTFKYTGGEAHIKDDVDLMTVDDILDELRALRSFDVPLLSDILANELKPGGKLPDMEESPQDGTIYGDTPKYTPSNLSQGDENAVNEEIMAQMRVVNIPWGEKKNAIMKYNQYDDIIAEFVALRNQTAKTKLSVALVKAMIYTESSFKEGETPGKNSNGVTKEGGYGLMQIEFGPSDGSKIVLEDEFKEWMQNELGKQVTNIRVDVLNPYYNIGFGTYKLAQKLDKYPGDYCKAIQGYNYGSVDKLVKEYGEDGWLANRPNAWKVFGNPYGNGRYGNPVYIEHVMSAFVP